MAPTVKAKAQTPVDAAADAFKALAAAEEAKTVRKAAEDFLKLDLKLTPQKIDYILTQEFGRSNPARLPQVNDKLELFRVNKKRETIVMDERYFREKFSELIPATSEAPGEVQLRLAAEAVSNRTIQAQMIRQFGAELTASLMLTVGGKLGEVREPVALKIGSNAVDSTNPWKNNAEGAVEARNGIIKRLGTRVASQMALAAGVDLAGRPLRVTSKA